MRQLDSFPAEGLGIRDPASASAVWGCELIVASAAHTPSLAGAAR